MKPIVMPSLKGVSCGLTVPQAALQTCPAPAKIPAPQFTAELDNEDCPGQPPRHVGDALFLTCAPHSTVTTAGISNKLTAGG